MTEPIFHTTPVGTGSPWQFGLRTVFFLMTSVSVLLLIMGLVGLVWSGVLVWFLLLVAAHVVGNSWSKRELARSGHQDILEAAELHAYRPAPLAADPGAVCLRQPAVFCWLDYAVICAAAVLGGGLGGSALWAAYSSHSGYSAIVVGAVSSGVLGGFLGFLCVTCARVAIWAVSDALRASQPDRYIHRSASSPDAPAEKVRPAIR